jgi:hypothetical protein
MTWNSTNAEIIYTKAVEGEWCLCCQSRSIVKLYKSRNKKGKEACELIKNSEYLSQQEVIHLVEDGKFLTRQGLQEMVSTEPTSYMVATQSMLGGR